MPKIPRKELRDAEDLTRTAEKILNYRKDLLPAEERQALRSATDAVRELRRKRADADPGAFKTAMDDLEARMLKSGGEFYPRRAWNENIEVLLVAAILAICIRMFFFQPFRIPTNSMYPTYNGMTCQLYADINDRPSLPVRVARAVYRGADSIRVDAPCDGEVVIPVLPAGSRFPYVIPCSAVNARKWFGLLPTVNARFMLLVGDTPVAVEGPRDFYMELMKAIFQRYGTPGKGLRLGSGGRWYYHTGVFLKKGDPVMAFDVLMGDQLFVDRVSYNFVRPKVGDPIVFRTDNIPGMDDSERGKYYIKRLVGTPGDVLQVKYPVLFRNGAPITGADAFDLNARRFGEYEGYLADITTRDIVSLEAPYTVPAGTFIGMGDNSDDSADSRVWGPMPQNAVVGRALVIYYPVTSHVGAAK